MGLPTRESESFEVEAGRYISRSVNSNYGFRTHVLLENPSGETVLSEGVQDSDDWRVFDSESDNRVVEQSAGEWLVVCTPADDGPETAGDVTVEVCTPTQQQTDGE